jgi:hypothetical protein
VRSSGLTYWLVNAGSSAHPLRSGAGGVRIAFATWRSANGSVIGWTTSPRERLRRDHRLDELARRRDAGIDRLEADASGPAGCSGSLVRDPTGLAWSSLTAPRPR